MNNCKFEGEPVFFAHSAAGKPIHVWQRLEDHLVNVANIARRFSEEFGAGEWGYLAGLWHDLGKYRSDWQDFIRQQAKYHGPDHSSAGAIQAQKKAKNLEAMLLAFVIAGHHGGLSDREDLRKRLGEKRQILDLLPWGSIPKSMLSIDKNADLPSWLKNIPPNKKEQENWKRAFEFFIRFLYSALVDADFLDTEEFYDKMAEPDDPARALRQTISFAPISSYWDRLQNYLQKLEADAQASRVNQLRSRVRKVCTLQASSPMGAYTLTVPTGGGKTLSGLAFALTHALHHGLRRVIFALPYTTIIDQTASVFRHVFKELGENILLEHHCAIDPEHETIENRLAAENWDAPLIVTSQVQLFESLFSNRTSACRKLHNIAGSVLILDEVQTLPHGMLAPLLDALQELVKNYHVTLLLMTATQPSLHSRKLAGWKLFQGLDPKPKEIIPPDLESKLWEGLRRVNVMWPCKWDVPLSDDEEYFWQSLANIIIKYDQVLSIVHRKDDAQRLWRILNELDPEALHLSAAMCPAHRKQVLSSIQEKLATGKKCRLVSTQVIEAGVDIDFPIVFRALAGLESLAQSAGRCNREGRLPGLGRFFIFQAPSLPPQALRLPLDTTIAITKDGTCEVDLFSPTTYLAYFDSLYAARDLDIHQIQLMREELRFLKTAEYFQMIGESTKTIFIPWDNKARQLINELRYVGPSRDRLRRLQIYSVSVYPQQLYELTENGAVEEVQGFFVLGDFLPNPYYHPVTGLSTKIDTGMAFLA
ncbi:MAG: CRISPR-associated helicase Cas3' [Clostridiales bacterium]|nr:CRISPR-associated helicase Cas3' [Clostridiales bacterium]